MTVAERRGTIASTPRGGDSHAQRTKQPTFERTEVRFRPPPSGFVPRRAHLLEDESTAPCSTRWSCRMGRVRFCGMMRKGYPRLHCATFLRGLHPAGRFASKLEKLPRSERDLVIVLDEFIESCHEQAVDREKHESRSMTASKSMSPAELATYKQLQLCHQRHAVYSACRCYQNDEHSSAAMVALSQRYNHDRVTRAIGRRRDVVLVAGRLCDATSSTPPV